MEQLRQAQLQSWLVIVPDIPHVKLRIAKTFPDGTNIIITIHETPHGYDVHTCAESRTSGPAETADATSLNFAAAIATVATECEEWDTYLS